MLKGIPVAPGLAIGRAFVIRPSLPTIQNESVRQTPEEEVKRLAHAVELAKVQIDELAAAADEHLSAADADIIRNHLNYLRDPIFHAKAQAFIREQGVSAEEAIQSLAKEMYQGLMDMNDGYFSERAVDLKDVGTRVLNILSGIKEPDLSHLEAGTILVAECLTPSQTARLDTAMVNGFVTEQGGATSHTAILARSLGLAAVSGCVGALGTIQDGDELIVDAQNGTVERNPSPERLQEARAALEVYRQELARYQQVQGQHLARGKTRPVLVLANIGNALEAKMALEKGADGIGLFRTEFLFMNRQTAPSEEEQYIAYREVVSSFQTAPVVIRTLDAGGDKPIPYLQMKKEENPFLALRAIRLCLQHPALFKIQLRALLRASAHGNLHLMFPMISSLDELRQAQCLLEECRGELKKEGKPFDPAMPVGMMVEIPAAALIADDFAKEVDFFSIGTNDLTQYTLAVDRGNADVAHLYNAMHPAVLGLIQYTIQAAHMQGISCGMCGELAENPEAIPLLNQYGLDEFSVGVYMIAKTKYYLLQQPDITAVEGTLSGI